MLTASCLLGRGFEIPLFEPNWYAAIKDSTREPDRTNRIFSSKDQFCRVARRIPPDMLFARFGPIGFLCHLRS